MPATLTITQILARIATLRAEFAALTAACQRATFVTVRVCRAERAAKIDRLHAVEGELARRRAS